MSLYISMSQGIEESLPGSFDLSIFQVVRFHLRFPKWPQSLWWQPESPCRILISKSHQNGLSQTFFCNSNIEWYHFQINNVLRRLRTKCFLRDKIRQMLLNSSQWWHLNENGAMILKGVRHLSLKVIWVSQLPRYLKIVFFWLLPYRSISPGHLPWDTSREKGDISTTIYSWQASLKCSTGSWNIPISIYLWTVFS